MIIAVAAAGLLAALYVYQKDRYQTAQLQQAWSMAILYVQSLRAEIDRRRHLPEILATDDDLAAFALGAEPLSLNHRFERLVKALDAEAAYLMDRTGNASWNTPAQQGIRLKSLRLALAQQFRLTAESSVPPMLTCAPK